MTEPNASEPEQETRSSDEPTLAELDAARRERLDPANRHPNTEVDNTHRHFNPETGHFDDYDEQLDGNG